jgi:uncharacterized protein
MDQEIMHPAPMPESPKYSVPWSVLDNWIGVILLVLIDILLVVLVVLQDVNSRFLQSAGLAIAELAYLLPVILIFAWRRIHWKHIGFGKFDLNTMGLGCGLLIAGYVIIFLHNLVLLALGVDTQGDAVIKMFAELDSPLWFFLVGVVFAPIVEEIFFRGFLFQGFRQRYGWVAAILISSFIFAAAHLDPVAFIPTFVLGSVLAYVYHRSNSVWPGIILHFLVNGFGLCGAYVVTQFPNLIPS